MQKELAFTPAKNTTIPNPFKIIPLQSTRKENNWESEETMERATSSGDGTGQMAQPWMFMMMMIIIIMNNCKPERYKRMFSRSDLGILFCSRKVRGLIFGQRMIANLFVFPFALPGTI
jgi:hypothetical protein